MIPLPTLETVTLLIRYIPIENEKLKKKKKNLTVLNKLALKSSIQIVWRCFFQKFRKLNWDGQNYYEWSNQEMFFGEVTGYDHG